MVPQTSFDRPAALFRYSNTGGANRETKIHPTQKPVALYEWILGKYAKEGDKILDTLHGGFAAVQPPQAATLSGVQAV